MLKFTWLIEAISRLYFLCIKIKPVIYENHGQIDQYLKEYTVSEW